MADASCSGGTPFKRLVEHQNRDVSHHQDRLVDNAAAQGHHAFRSAPQHPSQMQNGFGSFMDGNAAIPTGPHHAAGRLAAHAAALDPVHASAFPAAAPGPVFAHQARASPSTDLNNWAADFARFSGQQRQPMQQPQAQHNGLVPQQAPMPQMHQQAPQNFQSMFQQPNFGYAPLYGPTNGGLMDPNAALAQRPAAEQDFDEEMSRWMAEHGSPRAGGMEDIDAVMEQMAQELEINEAALAEAESQTQRETATEVLEPRIEHAHFTDLETPEIGSLSLESRKETPAALEPEAQPKPKSEVAEAAERLLESVQDEEGEKWKNSVFLSLMRDFRDGKKDIIDNEVRETDGVADAPPPTASHSS